MTHIFISYAKRDTRDFALNLRDVLSALPDVTAWMDDSLEAGESWAGQIQEEIDRCDWVIVLLSPDVNRAGGRRSFVLNEIDYAQSADKPIIPLMVQPTRVPVQIAGVQYIDFAGDEAAAWNSLMRHLEYPGIMPPSHSLHARRLGSPPPAPVVKTSRIEPAIKPRRLEAAMPEKTKVNTRTEVRVKISIEGSEGLRGELPAVVPSGDVIHKGDVQAASFTIEFPRDDASGKLLPTLIRVEIVSSDFDVMYVGRSRVDLLPNEAEVKLLPDHDSQTLIFELTLDPGNAHGERSRVYVNLYQNEEPIAHTAVSTAIVQSADQLASTVWNLMSVVLAGASGQLPLPRPIAARQPRQPSSAKREQHLDEQLHLYIETGEDSEETAKDLGRVDYDAQLGVSAGRSPSPRSISLWHAPFSAVGVTLFTLLIVGACFISLILPGINPMATPTTQMGITLSEVALTAVASTLTAMPSDTPTETPTVTVTPTPTLTATPTPTGTPEAAP